MLVPVVGELNPAVTSLTDGVLEFIKWDLILGAGSVILVMFWMADNARHLAGILVWYHVVWHRDFLRLTHLGEFYIYFWANPS